MQVKLFEGAANVAAGLLRTSTSRTHFAHAPGWSPLAGVGLGNGRLPGPFSSDPSAGGQRRSIFKVIDAAPVGVRPLYHGTKESTAQRVIHNASFEGRRQIYDRSESGPYADPAAVYASTDPQDARLWGRTAASLANEKVAVIEIYPPEGNDKYVAMAVPDKERSSMERTRAWLRSDAQSAHTVLLSSARAPVQEVMLTQRAAKDPDVVFGLRLRQSEG